MKLLTCDTLHSMSIWDSALAHVLWPALALFSPQQDDFGFPPWRLSFRVYNYANAVTHANFQNTPSYVEMKFKTCIYSETVFHSESKDSQPFLLLSIIILKHIIFKKTWSVFYQKRKIHSDPWIYHLQIQLVTFLPIIQSLPQSLRSLTRYYWYA